MLAVKDVNLKIVNKLWRQQKRALGVKSAKISQLGLLKNVENSHYAGLATGKADWRREKGEQMWKTMSLWLWLREKRRRRSCN